MFVPPDGVFPDEPVAPAPDKAALIAVMGDSDSQGFQDRVYFPAGGRLRGGANQHVTLQWTEVLSRMRGDTVDLGPRAVWGGRRTVVKLMAWLGCQRRLPRKHDHCFNFAFGGANCDELVGGVAAQLPSLLRVMTADPERWREGVVIIRVGIVDLGGPGRLQAMARDPDAAELVERIDACVGHVRAAVERLRAAHPETRIGLVGILNNVDHPPQFARFRSRRSLENVTRALDRFDDGLREIASTNDGIAFFDDRAWFRGRWGERGPNGELNYRSVRLGSHDIEHAMGDDPRCSVLADGHAGLAWNVMWAQALVDWLRDEFDLPVDPISDQEAGAFFDDLAAKAVPR